MSKTFYNAKNLRLKNGFARNPDRYYLEEYFEKLPQYEITKLSSITNRGDTNSNTTDETTLHSFTVEKRSLAHNDIVHIKAMATVLSINPGDSVNIIIRIKNFNDDFKLIETNNVSLITGDTIHLDLYIYAEYYNINLDILEDADITCNGILTLGSSNPQIFNFKLEPRFDDEAFNSIKVDHDTFIEFNNKWDNARFDNILAVETTLFEVNGNRLESGNNNFVYKLNNDESYRGGDNEIISYEINNGHSGIRILLLEFDWVVLIPNRIRQSPWRNITFRSGYEIEWECAFKLGKIAASSFSFGIVNTIDIDDLNYLYQNRTDQISFVFNQELNDENRDEDEDLDFFSITVIITIGEVHYLSVISRQAKSEKLYKARISIDNNRFARVYLNDVQYNITTIAGEPSNDVSPGSIPSKQLNDSVAFEPFVIGFSDDDTERPKIFLYYIKMSRGL